MQNLLIAPVVLSAVCLASCVATRAAMENLEKQVLEVTVAYEELETATITGASNLAELDERFASELEDVEIAKDELAVAITEDAKAVKNRLGGILGLGVAGDGGILALLLTAGSWLLRDRRKRKGTDPLQREDVVTPEPRVGA